MYPVLCSMNGKIRSLDLLNWMCQGAMYKTRGQMRGRGVALLTTIHYILNNSYLFSKYKKCLHVGRGDGKIAQNSVHLFCTPPNPNIFNSALWNGPFQNFKWNDGWAFGKKRTFLFLQKNFKLISLLTMSLKSFWP